MLETHLKLHIQWQQHAEQLGQKAKWPLMSHRHRSWAGNQGDSCPEVWEELSELVWQVAKSGQEQNSHTCLNSFCTFDKGSWSLNYSTGLCQVWRFLLSLLFLFLRAEIVLLAARFSKVSIGLNSRQREHLLDAVPISCFSFYWGISPQITTNQVYKCTTTTPKLPPLPLSFSLTLLLFASLYNSSSVSPAESLFAAAHWVRQMTY